MPLIPLEGGDELVGITPQAGGELNSRTPGAAGTARSPLWRRAV